MKLLRRGAGPRAVRAAVPAGRASSSIAQTANILLYLGAAPRARARRTRRAGCTRTSSSSRSPISSAEVHDTHHPIASSLYYEDQKPEAQRRAAALRRASASRSTSATSSGRSRRSGGAHLVGDAASRTSTCRCSRCSTASGTPSRARWRGLARRIRARSRSRERVAARPRIAAYLASPRRIPFNEDGIFRHYPELDVDARVKAL